MYKIFSERPILVEKIHKLSTKHPKIRKRETLMSIWWERNPEKILKNLQELSKLSNLPINRKICSRSEFPFSSLPARGSWSL